MPFDQIVSKCFGRDFGLWPSDPEFLKESVLQLVDVLRGKPEEEAEITGLRLSMREQLIVGFLVASEEFTLNRECLLQKVGGSEANKNSFKVQLSVLRRKLEKHGLGISISSVRADPELSLTGKNLDFLRRQVQQRLFDNREKLKSIVGPCDGRLHPDGLPDDTAALRRMAVQLLGLLRGDQETFVTPGIHLRPPEKIFLGTLLAKTGVVSRDRLFMALYPPYVDEPPSMCMFDKTLSGLRQKMKAYGVDITSNQYGAYLDQENRQRLMIRMNGFGKLPPLTVRAA